MVKNVLCGVACIATSTFSQAKENPNILCILVDDLGYGDLSCMGATDMQTPNIDQLMQDGMKFTNFYANSTVCSPTRASLLTGQYPDMVGVPGVIRQWEHMSWGFFKPDAVTLPDMLKKAGYHTGIIGKWHLGLESPNLPNERGFDHFHGFLSGMMDNYWTHLRGGVNWMRLNDHEIDPKGHATDIFTQWSVDYIKERTTNNEKFFLYLAYNAPHDPIQPPEEWYIRVKKRESGITDKRAKLVALIEHLDSGIGKVIESLKEQGIYDETLIIFTSDNGGFLKYGANNGPFRGGKQDLYEGGIKVPACFVWKNHIEAGNETNAIALSMDIFPTLCDIAGANITTEIDGISIWPLLQGKKQETDDRHLFWVRREGFKYGGKAYYACRNKNLKILQNNPFIPVEYYNIQNDPVEENNLEKKGDKYNELWINLQKHIREAGAVPWQN
jgi:arylsulfatase A-like enzyme